MASELARRASETVARGGVRALFDPLTAAGHGAQSLDRTTLVLDVPAARG